MPRYTKAQRKRFEKKFASLVAQGFSQSEAYRQTFPERGLSNKKVSGNASSYAKKPEVQELIAKAISAIDALDAEQVVKGVVKDAKGAKKEVLDGDGNKVTLKDNQATASARDHFFKLTNHPAFSKQINIDNRQQNVSLDKDSIDALTRAVERLEALKGTFDAVDVDNEALGKVEVVDVEVVDE